MNKTIDQVAERALKLIRDGHHYNPAVMLAVYEVHDTADDFLEVLSVLRKLVEEDNSLRSVARKMARTMGPSGEPEEFQTCFQV